MGALKPAILPRVNNFFQLLAKYNLTIAWILLSSLFSVIDLSFGMRTSVWVNANRTGIAQIL